MITGINTELSEARAKPRLHSYLQHLRRSMFQQADPPTPLVTWGQRSASSGGSVQVVRVLLCPIEVYLSYSHEDIHFVAAAQEVFFRGVFPQLANIQLKGGTSQSIPSFSTPLLSASWTHFAGTPPNTFCSCGINFLSLCPVSKGAHPATSSYVSTGDKYRAEACSLLPGSQGSRYLPPQIKCPETPILEDGATLVCFSFWGDSKQRMLEQPLHKSNSNASQFQDETHSPKSTSWTSTSSSMVLE